MTTRYIRSTSKRPFTGSCGWLRPVAGMGNQGFMSHPTRRLAALQLLAGYEDPMHPGRGSA